MTAQQRLERIQLVNWGTFNGSFTLPVPRDGLLITGPSGSGKSSLLDALAAVLVQPKWLMFNAAAQEGGVSDRNRSLISYVRGAFKREADDATGEVSTAYLRTGATWSGIALTFDDGTGAGTSVIDPGCGRWRACRPHGTASSAPCSACGARSPGAAAWSRT